MSILSITFHTTENRLAEWGQYCENELFAMVENLMDVDKYILSEVDTEMLREGRNTNLLLVFADEDLRQGFLLSELPNITERIEKVFGQEVMIFPTMLNPKRLRF
ncbi:DUF4286 family protein [Soonwooa sp.]|uniref:DUF4286 family protein n=1 Tax=Soonwooa sp. TaxID=1938592 RepID=UPI002608B50F|nr:DUF4286 family protein [Soonwooa sp.]